MKRIDSSLQCPSCHGPLKPKVLGCDTCEIKVEGPFEMNEFATLAPEDLHFLRIFVLCEGRVREMEPALGLSYPTIRSRLSDLKNKLLAAGEKKQAADQDTLSTQEILKQLDDGLISFDEAMKRIRAPSKKG